MIGVALVPTVDGKWEALLVESGSGAVTQLSPTWQKQLKVDEPGYVEETDKQSGKKHKVKTLLTRVVGTHTVRGESLAVALGRAQKWLAVQAGAKYKPGAK